MAPLTSLHSGSLATCCPRMTAWRPASPLGLLSHLTCAFSFLPSPTVLPPWRCPSHGHLPSKIPPMSIALRPCAAIPERHGAAAPLLLDLARPRPCTRHAQSPTVAGVHVPANLPSQHEQTAFSFSRSDMHSGRRFPVPASGRQPSPFLRRAAPRPGHLQQVRLPSCRTRSTPNLAPTPCTRRLETGRWLLSGCPAPPYLGADFCRAAGKNSEANRRRPSIRTADGSTQRRQASIWRRNPRRAGTFWRRRN